MSCHKICANFWHSWNMQGIKDLTLCHAKFFTIYTIYMACACASMPEVPFHDLEAVYIFFAFPSPAPSAARAGTRQGIVEG